MPASERLIAQFAAARLRTGAGLRSVERDISRCGHCYEPALQFMAHAPWLTFSELPLVSSSPIYAASPISRSTGHARLLAARRFVRFLSENSGRSLGGLAALDELLPRQPSSRWPAAGTLVVAA